MYYYHIKEILDIVDYRNVVKQLQIEHYESNGRFYVRCPEHEERTGKMEHTIDNCVLSRSGYHCFSCGASGNLIKLVEKTQGVSFLQAVELILDADGLPREDYAEHGYSPKNEEPQYSFPLTMEEVELLNLKTNVTAMNPNGMCLNKRMEQRGKAVLPIWDENAYVTGGYEPYSLYRLWVEDSNAFWEMIVGKIKEAQCNTAAVLQSEILDDIFQNPFYAYQAKLELYNNLIKINQMAARYFLPIVTISVPIRRKSRFVLKKTS